MQEVTILGVCIEAGADLAIVVMTVAVDRDGVFLEQCQEQDAEGGTLGFGAGVGGDTFIVETTDVGDANGVAIVAATMANYRGYIVSLENRAVLEDDEMVARACGRLEPQEVGWLHLAVWSVGGAVDDDFRYPSHWLGWSLICSRYRRWKR